MKIELSERELNIITQFMDCDGSMCEQCEYELHKNNSCEYTELWNKLFMISENGRKYRECYGKP